MVRLDAELLARVPSTLSPLSDRELDLRGYKIPAIENLGVTRDSLDSLDLTDNSITTLSNFPLLRRLQHLLLSSNPIRTISPSLPTSLPNLRTLILTNSAVPKDALGAVGEVLARCRKLEMLSFKGSPLSEVEGYRSWVIYKCPSLRSLDFERVKEKERVHAKSLYETSTGSPTALATSIISSVPATSNTFEPGVDGAKTETAAGKAGRLLSKEEKDRVRKAIEGAGSVEEIRRLQRMLAQGFVPTEKDLKDLERKKGADGMDED
ncbi:U2 small nuclear ribonucleoprotein A' [Pseudohyphozyma bogoriensis]|nr:U2 small nuclear ribonucleoprotein A' [Pseudohyphozyma bogoriensis]